ncbi:MAG: OsmC family protein [Bacteroidales bacterium]|jgi:uncharacterized OsmC-like protein|nr:OsmC family protein [Bacteroidales bacterium]
MKITFEKPKKIVAQYEGHSVITDLTKDLGGENLALNPFQLFLTSLGSCGALFMRLFYENHNIDIEGASLNQDFEFDNSGNLKKVIIKVKAGKQFPMDKKEGLIAMMKSCKVKKHVSPSIEFEYIVEQ